MVLRHADVDPRWSATLVFATMASFTLPAVARRTGRRSPDGGTRSIGDWGWIIGCGVANAANVGLSFAAFAKTTVAVAILSHYLAPAIVSLIAPIVVRTPRQRGALWRALAATFALALVLEPWQERGAGDDVFGALFGAASALFYALNICMIKRAAPKFQPSEILGYHSAIAALVLLPIAFTAPAPPGTGIVAIIAGAVLLGGVAGLLFTRGTVRIPAEHAAILTMLEPLTAVLLGALVFEEHLGPLALLGAAGVIAIGISAVRAPAVTASSG